MSSLMDVDMIAPGCCWSSPPVAGRRVGLSASRLIVASSVPRIRTSRVSRHRLMGVIRPIARSNPGPPPASGTLARPALVPGRFLVPAGWPAPVAQHPDLALSRRLVQRPGPAHPGHMPGVLDRQLAHRNQGDPAVRGRACRTGHDVEDRPGGVVRARGPAQRPLSRYPPSAAALVAANAWTRDHNGRCFTHRVHALVNASVARPAIPGWPWRLCVPWPRAGAARLTLAAPVGAWRYPGLRHGR